MVNKKSEVKVVVEPRMIQKGDLDRVVQDMLARQRSMKNDIDLCINSITDPSIMRFLTRKSVECENKIKGLEAGFIPVDGLFFSPLESKSKWRVKEVDKEMKTMPSEVKSAYERCIDLGIFEGFGITTYRKAPDPTFAGRIGRVWFFIASWTNFEGGYTAGFIARSARVD
jgi:hypothetical protein